MGELTNPILEFQKEYRWLSNFWNVPIHIEGITYKSVEHFFQARKFPSEKWLEVAQAQRPKQLGKQAHLPADWDKIKQDIMWLGLTHKFNVPEMRKMLINTGTNILVEGNYWHDNFWGNCLCPKCKHKQGLNMLGNKLMQIRSKIIGGTL
jgi:ribA/ribD-fused uncharacterized protein